MKVCKRCGMAGADEDCFCAGCGSSELSVVGGTTASLSTARNMPNIACVKTEEKNGLAIAGFVLSLTACSSFLMPLFLVYALVASAVGIALSAVGYAKALAGKPKKGLALAGIVLGSIAAVYAVFVLSCVVLASFYAAMLPY